MTNCYILASLMFDNHVKEINVTTFMNQVFDVIFIFKKPSNCKILLEFFTHFH